MITIKFPYKITHKELICHKTKESDEILRINIYYGTK